MGTVLYCDLIFTVMDDTHQEGVGTVLYCDLIFTLMDEHSSRRSGNCPILRSDIHGDG